MEPGLYERLPVQEYAKLPYINQSMMKWAERSMAHVRAYTTGKLVRKSEAMSFGAAFHVYLLEPERFASAYAVIPKMRRAGKAWEEALAAAEASGKEVLFADDLQTIVEMREALLAESRRRAITTAKGQYEVTIIWDDPHTGLRCKGRIDKLIPAINTAVDLKKTTDARDRAFGRSAADFGYALQAAFYMDGLRAVTGKPHDMVYLCIEDEPPYLSAMYRVMPSTEAYRVGRWQYRNTMAAIKQCKASGVWPGYGDDVNELVLPKWAIPQGIMESNDDNGTGNAGGESADGGRIVPTDRRGQPLAARADILEDGDAAQGDRHPGESVPVFDVGV